MPQQQFHILRVVKTVGIAHVNDVLPIGEALQQLLQEIQLLKNAPLHLERLDGKTLLCGCCLKSEGA